MEHLRPRPHFVKILLGGLRSESLPFSGLQVPHLYNKKDRLMIPKVSSRPNILGNIFGSRQDRANSAVDQGLGPGQGAACPGDPIACQPLCEGRRTTWRNEHWPVS